MPDTPPTPGAAAVERDAIEALLSRVMAATGPDRELDADIEVAVCGGDVVWKQANYTMEQYPAIRRPSRNHTGGFANEHCPLLTASIDAAAALVERVLPGALWMIEQGGDNDHGCTLTLKSGEQFSTEWVVVPAPLAILAALLTAVLATRSGNKESPP